MNRNSPLLRATRPPVDKWRAVIGAAVVCVVLLAAFGNREKSERAFVEGLSANQQDGDSASQPTETAPAQSGDGHELHYLNSIIRYSGNVTEQDARRFGDFLKEGGAFKGKHWEIRLGGSGTDYFVKTGVPPPLTNDKEYAKNCGILMRRHVYKDFSRRERHTYAEHLRLYRLVISGGFHRHGQLVGGEQRIAGGKTAGVRKRQTAEAVGRENNLRGEQGVPKRKNDS